MQRVIDVLQTDLFMGNTISNVVMFVLAIGATAVFVKLVEWFVKTRLAVWAEASDNQLDDVLIEKLDKPIQYILLAVGFELSVGMLILPADLHGFTDQVIIVVVTVFIAWALTRVQDGLRKTFVDPWVEATESKLDDQIVPILDKALTAAVWTMAVLIAFSNLGVDILSLLTGLGIGGLAVAMAAQATLSNVFGSITIFADQPFQVDDLIEVGDHQGVVEEVGLRTTKLRTMKGSIINVPNAYMVAEPVENKAGPDGWRHDFTIGLEYSTTSDELDAAIATLKQILEEHRYVSKHAVRFMNFGESSLDLAVAIWVLPEGAGPFLDTVNEVNLAIKKRFDDGGFNMAFPTRTVHVIK
jgi:MscS family membrane protein